MTNELELKYGCNPNQKPARIFIKEGELPEEQPAREKSKNADRTADAARMECLIILHVPFLQ